MDEDVKTTEISKKMTQPIMDLITKFFRSKADEFSKDDDFEYIELSSQVASLNPISIGESESIYTKLKNIHMNLK